MDINEMLDGYNEMRRKVEKLIRDDPSLLGEDLWLQHAILNRDMTLTPSEDGTVVYVSGAAYTQQTGGSHEAFDFTIPAHLLIERPLTLGELRERTKHLPDDTHVTLVGATCGSEWLNLAIEAVPNEHNEHITVILDSRDTFDTRQF